MVHRRVTAESKGSFVQLYLAPNIYIHVFKRKRSKHAQRLQKSCMLFLKNMLYIEEYKGQF